MAKGETFPRPEVGKRAPAFQGVDQSGAVHRLKDYAGRKVALYFYPKDDTPGCTKQACNLRDGFGALKKAGIVVIGVSRDPESSHARFAQKYDLPFPLLADTDLKILKKYGAWGEKNMYGKKSVGVKRSTYLIDETGRIVHIIKRPKTDDHTAEVLAKFESQG